MFRDRILRVSISEHVKLMCTKCGKNGHYASECFSVKTETQQDSLKQESLKQDSLKQATVQSLAPAIDVSQPVKKYFSIDLNPTDSEGEYD